MKIHEIVWNRKIKDFRGINRKLSLSLLAGLFVLYSVHLVFAGKLFALDEKIRIKEFNLEDGVAIGGYDPVSYFTVNRAVKGDSKITFTYNGVTYYFSSRKNRDLFQKNSEKYEPMYGGWCAYAMGADGSKVEVDPGTFKILDGKLYLFYNYYFSNTLPAWNRDEARLKANADRYWNGYIKAEINPGS